MSAGRGQQPTGRPVGGVHEETARLFAALEGAAAAWSRGEARPDDGSSEEEAADGDLPTSCGVCPACLALDRLGRRHPDVVAHLGDAVRALGAAFAALSTDVPGEDAVAPPATDRSRAVKTVRIDVTD